jgi:putative transposase
MARKKKKEHPAVHRTDLLPSNLTKAKKAQVIDVLRLYRRGAVLLGAEQWFLFFVFGEFNPHYDLDKASFSAVIGSAARVQMGRYQVVGQLQSWISNRANEFRTAVQKSSLPTDTKHQLHTINLQQAWYQPQPVQMKDGPQIPAAVRKIARVILRGVMARHRKPDLSGISMRLDRRAADLQAPQRATQGGAIAY